MRIYNTMTKKKEEFIPIEEKKVKMYACGITVYDDCHIGHARQAIIYDIMARYLRYRGYDVTYVRNYTDVDDKIIAKANAIGENPITYSARKIREAEIDLIDLGIKDADIKPRASENIESIIQFISNLVEKGNAYVNEKGDVYFSVESFPGYGKLSNRNTEELIDGVRKEVEEGKKNPKDFALWKSAKEGEISWEAPWGQGRPGWHIECSAMILNNLGENIDIHGGGKDLIFPHHENEIAQSEALTGKPFVNYWTHNGLVKINGQKMSKSLGNSMTIREALNIYNPEVIRFAMINKHYSSDIDLNEREFSIAEKHLYYFYNTLNRVKKFLEKAKPKGIDTQQFSSEGCISNKIEGKFIEAMDDDFNTSEAITQLYTICKYVNNLLENLKYPNIAKAKVINEIERKIIETYSVIGLLQQEPEKFIENMQRKYIEKTGITKEKIDELVQERLQAKKGKDYQKADAIREKLNKKGIILQDLKEGSTWDLKVLYEIENKKDKGCSKNND